MKVLRINLDYGDTKDLASQEVSANYITGAVNSAYPQGLEGQLRRMYGRIQRKLDEVLENKSETLELEESEYDFVVKAFESAKFPASLSKWVMTLEEELERAKKETA